VRGSDCGRAGGRAPGSVVGRAVDQLGSMPGPHRPWCGSAATAIKRRLRERLQRPQLLFGERREIPRERDPAHGGMGASDVRPDMLGIGRRPRSTGMNRPLSIVGRPDVLHRNAKPCSHGA
jgi:hypothetical protein